MNGKITGVSLGPGEPELITVKALKTLQAADVIFCPATLRGKEERESKAARILEALGINTAKIRFFLVPMSTDRTAVNKVYDEICKEMAECAGAGQKVSLTAEGDACFYSSAHYIFEKLQRLGISVEMIAGVPAFIAAGASVGLHIVKQRARMLVIPGEVSAEELESALNRVYTVVIMKVPLGEEIVRSYMAHHPEEHYFYFEQVGTAAEYITSVYAEILKHPFTYFSILVIQAAKRHKNITE